MEEPTPKTPPSPMKISVLKDGPYVVKGGIPLKEKIITPVGAHYEYREGKELPQNETYTLCRCGHSSNPPFCDGAHIKEHFDGTETASHLPFEERAEVFDGPGLDLHDDHRCALARFCHREDGSAWEMTKSSDDPRIREEALKSSMECPAGRLVHYDKEGKAFEPELEPCITVLEDPQKGVSAAVYVQGGVPLISADGKQYEVRNRYTLCRCGHSMDKPFCDARHVHEGFEA